MRKGDQTRELILAKAAKLFNRQGYSGATLSDIMRETGLEKGGIYNHFGSKEELALACFEYSFELVTVRFEHALNGPENAVERLLNFVNALEEMAENPPLSGGCPVLNTAVEADDNQPALRTRVRRALDSWLSLIKWTVIEGLENKQLKPGIDADKVATIIISTYEGAVMFTRLYRDIVYMQRVAEHLREYIITLQA